MLKTVQYKTFDREYYDEGVWGGLRRVALNSNRQVVGIHHPDNTDLWEDGTEVDWAKYESNGWNCMVQIPKFYYRIQNGEYEGFDNVYRAEVYPMQVGGSKLHPAFERDDGIIENYQYFSAFEGWVDGQGKLRSLPDKTPTTSKTRAAIRNHAENNGHYFTQQDFYLTAAIQLLFITEYGSFNSQNVLGQGRATGSSSYIETGLTRQYGNRSYGSLTSNSEPMSYRGIENFYGNYWKWMDGLNVQNRQVYVAKKNFVDDVFDNQYKYVADVPSASNDYITDFHRLENEFDFTFIPSNVTGGSATSYLGDGLWTSTGNRVANFGGQSIYGASVGAFCLQLNSNSSLSSSYVVGRLQCIKS